MCLVGSGDDMTLIASSVWSEDPTPLHNAIKQCGGHVDESCERDGPLVTLHYLSDPAGDRLAELLQNFHAVNFIHPRPKSRNVAKFIASLPCSVRCVGVNADAFDILAFYPHASYLPLKVGGAFRYRGTERVVLRRPLVIPRALRLWKPLTRSGFTAWDRTAALDGEKKNAMNALQVERLLSYLVHGGKLNAAAYALSLLGI